MEKKTIISELMSLKNILESASRESEYPFTLHLNGDKQVPVFLEKHFFIRDWNLFYTPGSNLEISVEHTYLDDMGEEAIYSRTNLLEEKSPIKSGIIFRVLDMRARLEYKAGREGYILGADAVILKEHALCYDYLGSRSLPMNNYTIRGTITPIKKK